MPSASSGFAPRPSLDAFWRDRTVTVGGGCGLIGSYVVPLLVESGAAVTVIDSLEGGDLATLDPVRDRIRFIQGDLRDRQRCLAWLDGQDMLINLAARASGVGYSRSHHGTMLIDNLLSGLAPIDAARHAGVRHVAVISSSCVYPDDVPAPTPELHWLTGLPERVNEGYGWAKRIEELAVEYLARESDLTFTVLRPFNVYGGNYAWKSEPLAHVIPSIVKRVLDGESPLVVWGSGEQRRNFLHGYDAAYVMLRVIESGAPEPVNIGYEDATSIAELVEAVFEVTGRRVPVQYDTSKPDGQARKSADATRLRQLTNGYAPVVSLREGLQDMVAWYERTFNASRASRPW